MTAAPKRKIRRVVVHFPGFEPLDENDHHQRYVRAAAQSASAFGFSVETGGLNCKSGLPRFDVLAHGPNWTTHATIQLLGHQRYINRLKQAPFHQRLARGFQAAATVAISGTFKRYAKLSWRFSLFFLFPFVVMGLGLAGFAAAAVLPVLAEMPVLNLLWSVPVSAIAFAFVFLPLAERAHVQHLLAHWQLAVSLAQLDDYDLEALIVSHRAALEEALGTPADEYLITGHSLGGTFAILALGAILQQNPALLDGKFVSLATLAGPGLQSSLMKGADVLRSRIKALLTSPAVFWVDFQCFTDMVNFYGGRVAFDNGFTDLAEPAIKLIRVKSMLTPEHYRRIRWDGLRVHRQFVLGSDRPSHYDFTLLTTGPFSARDFVSYGPGVLPPLSEDGTVLLP